MTIWPDSKLNHGSAIRKIGYKVLKFSPLQIVLKQSSIKEVDP